VHSIPELSQLFNHYLQEQHFNRKPKSLYEPVSYILGLGGKHLRPLLVMMSAELFGRNPAEVLPQSFAVELFHNFSLIHDDIMDEAPIRRGKETVHKKYDRNTAILSGDVMLVYAYEYLLKNNPPSPGSLVSVFNQTAIEVCEGQQLDLEFESLIPSAEAYIEMITLKTAVLLGGALRIGAIMGGASESDAHHIYEFGKNTGIAFQLLDDILDTFGNAEEFGKRIGGDIIQNKKTILLLGALQRANREQAAELHSWLSRSNDETGKIAAVKNIFIDTGAESYARDLLNTYHQKASEALQAVQVAPEKKEVLTAFADLMLRRTR